MRFTRLRNGWRWVTSAIGIGEVLLVVGLALMVIALWPAVGRVALLPVGGVLVWLALPARMAFVVRPPTRKSRRI